MTDRLRVLLDTDIGNDIDDAVCLAYLLAHPCCDLLGVTTVTAEPVARARLVSALCRAAGRDVPILPGAAEPLATPPLQEPPPQAAALARWDHQVDFPDGAAVEFLRRQIRAHPGEVTLLAIGPLTNVALLFAVDPAAAGMLKALVLMGGRYLTGGESEWNIRNDPLAAATVFDPGLCAFGTGEVTVDRADGATGWRAGDGPHEIAVDVDPAAFLAHYFATVG